MKYFSKANSLDDVKTTYKKLALINHPDMKDGNTQAMQEINAEFEFAFALFKHKSTVIIEKDDTANNFTRHFYTENGWQGSRYDRSLRTKDIAKIMREYVKLVYPTWKFSVRMDYNSLYVAIMEAPVDVYTSVGRAELFNGEAYSQLNPYYFKESENITDYCKEVLVDVYAMLMSYNYDDSDINTDYFDTNFYINLHIGKWDKPFQVVEKRGRIHSTETVEGAKLLSE